MAEMMTHARPGRDLQNIIPLYFRVFLVLDQKIRAGVWPSGVAMPSEQELAAEYGVSRVTIRKTMALLEEARLITRHRGRGTFVNPEVLNPATPDGIRGFKDNIREFEETTAVELHEFAEVDIPADLPREVAQPLEGRALRIRRTRSRGGVPFSHSVAYVFPPESALLSAQSLGRRTVVAALEDHGFVFSHAEQRLTAVAADPELAGYLDMAPGAPLICMRRAVFDAASHLVEFLRIYYNPDLFEYRVSLARETDKSQTPQWVRKGS
ncbi:MAG: GntR family transcriptional regulator [Paracoccus sp. (in: a-proteobacteria)]|uniref:GntR family transcriptional regulator n=1 Tax=Paracoccus sp. TaxID=267 RepID=UPI0039E666C6